ncbi:MAG TPA: aminoacyl--tRNA ligase-related protein [Candidatus Paceibacterota bacterium]|nr:aminoacyl--tRNA ligase-related protein [Candidatus Paceibacterota bacterium]
MRQSELFTRTQKSAPKDEVALNAQLLSRGGFIYKNSAGVYSFLPLGFRVLEKIKNIIREEMNAVGGQELIMAALHDKHYLQASGRWDVDVVYKVIDGTANDGDKAREPSFNISWTHEEIIAEIATKYVSSYKDLPFAAYQIQTKFRHEPRAKSGLLRGREFLMKDMYSFHASEKDLMEYYDRVGKAYKKVFDRCGLKAHYTLAAGGEFTMSNTHEFQVISDVGEDAIYVCEKCGYAENSEISKLKKGAKCPTCGGAMQEEKSIEVGNIFPLGTKYSKAFGLQFTDEKGKKQDVVMGSYGIGVTRLMGTIVELFHDDHGILWPESVAPFTTHLLALNDADASDAYEALRRENIDVLYDDRAMSAGEKFAESDLIGIPWRIVASPKLGPGVLEVKRRGEKEARTLKLEEAVRFVSSH